jgi:uncharacterized membrane protein
MGAVILFVIIIAWAFKDEFQFMFFAGITMIIICTYSAIIAYNNGENLLLNFLCKCIDGVVSILHNLFVLEQEEVKQ